MIVVNNGRAESEDAVTTTKVEADGATVIFWTETTVINEGLFDSMAVEVFIAMKLVLASIVGPVIMVAISVIVDISVVFETTEDVVAFAPVEDIVSSRR